MKRGIISIILSLALSFSLCSSFMGTAQVKAADITVKDGDIAGGDLELLKATPVTVTKSESYGSYAIYSFKTSAVKAYYNVIWSGNAEDEVKWELYNTPNREDLSYVYGEFDANKKNGELGSVLGLGHSLSPETTYYIALKRSTEKDYSGTITVKYVMDEEADKSELASPIEPDKTTYGSIDSNKDMDVFYLDTGNNDYSLTFDCDANVLFQIYKDPLLGNQIYPTSQVTSTKVSDLDLTYTLEHNHTYYVVVNHWGDPKGDQIGYQILFKKIGSVDSTPTNTEVEDDTTDTTPTTDSSSSSKVSKNGKYYKSIKKSKAFVTNMGSKVTVTFKNGKVTLKKGSDGYLFKKSKARNYVFTKHATLGKKKYTYKLAKGCKIIQGTDFYSNSKITEKKQTKSWVKSHFKNGGGGDSIGLCLNSKGQVTMIYVSGFDVYAEN